jgi:hypothetical protein
MVKMTTNKKLVYVLALTLLFGLVVPEMLSASPVFSLSVPQAASDLQVAYGMSGGSGGNGGYNGNHNTRPDSPEPFLSQLRSAIQVASTVPANGEVNPYGVAIVQATTGNLDQGDVLVSNFNNKANQQGTGTTIIQIAPDGTATLFAQINATKLPGACPGGVGLTTALVELRSGWVIVGSLPTKDGTSPTAQAGCLIVLNNQGQVVETFSGSDIDGPWDMTAFEEGNHVALFVTNVLNGTVPANGTIVNQGTVVRIDLNVPYQGMLQEVSSTIIGSGFGQRTDPAALVIGPTGLALATDGTLYVADSLANRTAAIPDALARQTSAGIGLTVSANGAINIPLGLTLAPNGDIIVANAGDGNLVEIMPNGNQVAVKTVEPAGAGTLFGLAIAPNNAGVYFVDDGTNTLNLLH